MASTVLRQLIRAGRHFELTWRYGFNLAPTLSYKLRSHALHSREATRVLAELNRFGVAVTSAERLLESHACYDELQRTVDGLEREQAEFLRVARAAAATPGEVGRKSFLYELLGARPALDPQTVFARFALQHPVLPIANAYFRMYTRLRYFNVWHTFASRAEAHASQLWHRDREDHFILKVFVYLSDIDDGAGPFTYAARTHPKGAVRRRPAYFMEGEVQRSSDEQMAAVVPRQDWIKCVGPRGTIVFADTRGYHKGGLARERERVMYTCMFTSQASQSPQLFALPKRLALPPDREQSFALAVTS